MTEQQEFIHEAEEKEAVEQPKEHKIDIFDILQMELREHMEKALDFKKKIETAKTNSKKKYYEKKLKKNNTEALKVLTAIERVKKGREQPAKLEEKNEEPTTDE